MKVIFQEAKFFGRELRRDDIYIKVLGPIFIKLTYYEVIGVMWNYVSVR